jgi:hypothetical protein
MKKLIGMVMDKSTSVSPLWPRQVPKAIVNQIEDIRTGIADLEM